MPQFTVLQNPVIMTALTMSLLCIGTFAYADRGGLQGFVGQWDVHVKTLRPEKSESTYTEKYEWVLDGKFLKGQTGRKADGTQDIIYATYDEQAKGYPFWIFSSAGTYLYLAPASWNSNTRVMAWKNPPQFDISYQSRCSFPDEKTRHYSLIMKNWKGTVLKELTWRAFRQSN